MTGKKATPRSNKGKDTIGTERQPGAGSYLPGRLLWWLAVPATIWSFGYTRMLNSDLWFHLAAGRLIVSEARLPRTDPWSYTAAGEPWHNHEWLADILYHLWATTFGIESLIYWEWLVLAATFGLLFHLLRQLSGSSVTAYLLLLFALSLAAPFFDVRPHLWSLLASAGLLVWTLPGPQRSWWALPALFLAWANLHGGFVFGLAALGLVLASHALFPEEPLADRAPGGGADFRTRSVGKRLLSIGVLWSACLGASLVNPLGLDVLLFPLHLAFTAGGSVRTNLVEWAGPFVPGGIQSHLYPLGLVLVGAAAVVLLWRLRQPRRRAEVAAILALTTLTAVMSLTSRRFITLFALVGALALARVVGDLRERRARPRSRTRKRARAWAVLAPAAALLVAAVRLAPYPWTPSAFHPLARTSRLPVDTLDFVEANGLEGRAFVYYLWAGYVHHRTAGALRVFIDPRSETVFDEETHRRYFQVANLRGGWPRVIEESGAELVLWPFEPPRARRVLLTLLSSDQWRKVYQDGQSVLLARRGFHVPGQPELPGRTPYRVLGEAREVLGRGEVALAAELFEEAAAGLPDPYPACTDLAALMRRQGETAKALAAIERCRRVYPYERLDELEREIRGRP